MGGRYFFALYSAGFGFRLGRHYLHVRRPWGPPLFSERHGQGCRYVDLLGFRATYRWDRTHA